MKKSLAHNAFFNVIYRILNVIFPLISAAYIARVLAPEGIGKTAYAQNIVSYFVMIAGLGIPTYGTREIARCKGDPVAVNKLFSELFVLNFLSTAFCCVGYFALVSAAFRADTLLYFVMGLELAFNFINIDWFYQGEEEYVYITLRSTLVKILSLVLLFLFVREREDYVVYGLIHCLGICCNYIFNVVHLRGRINPVLRGLNLKRHLKPILYLMLSAVTASLYSKVDITMLGWLSVDAAVGYYTNAYKAVNVVLTLTTAITAVFLPRLSYVYRNNRQEFEQYLTMGLKILLLLVLPCCMGLIVVAEEVVEFLFGPLFTPAAVTVQILALLIIIRGVGDLMCYQALISAGKEKALIKVRILAGIANIVLNGLLIPGYGHNGAAVASVFSEIIVNGLLLPYALSIIHLDVSKAFLGSLIVSTAVMTLAAVGVQAVMGTGLLPLGATVASGAVVYGAMLLLLKNETAQWAVAALKQRLIGK